MTSRPLRIALVRGRVVFGHQRFVSPRVRRATLVVVLALSLVGHPEPVAAAQFRTAAMPSLSPDSSGVGRRTAVFESSIALDAPPDSFADPPRPWVRPTTKPVVERFSLPSGQYGAGQRGVVFATGPGDAVASIGEGTVSFVGVVAGTFWISIEHADAFVSMNPQASPMATTFLFQACLRMPVVKRKGRGSASGRPSRLASRMDAASSSLRWRLQ